MKKIVNLTETNLSRIVKQVINEQEERYEEEGDNNVQKLVSILVDNDLIDMDKVNIYDDHIEVYSIKGFDFPYFEENFIKLHPNNIDEGMVYVQGEDYGEEIDDDQYEDVVNHIYSNWEDKTDLEFID